MGLVDASFSTSKGLTHFLSSAKHLSAMCRPVTVAETNLHNTRGSDVRVRRVMKEGICFSFDLVAFPPDV